MLLVAGYAFMHGAYSYRSASQQPHSDPSRTGEPRGPESPGGELLAPSAPVESRIASAVRFRVITALGDGLPGITATWTPIPREWRESRCDWPDLDWASLGALSRTFTSDAEGWFEVAAASIDADTAASVFWITSLETRARPFLVPLPVPELPDTIALENDGPLSVHVLDRNGEPAEGAVVIALPNLNALDCASETDFGTDALWLLRHTSSTGHDGEVNLTPFPGEHWVRAELGPQLSEAWIGRAPATVTLRLHSTFSAGGQVLSEDGTTLESGMHVSCYARRGGDVSLLQRVSVRSDGTWGDVSLPLVACDQFLFQLRGGSVELAEVAVSPPSPGQRVVADFRPRLGLRLLVIVNDTESHGLDGAMVQAQWNVDGTSRDLFQTTDSEGRAHLRNLYPGMLWLRVRREGFTPNLINILDAQSASRSSVLVVLERAGVIEGRCVQLGKPVSDFVVRFWGKGPAQAGKVEVRGNKEGRFRIDEASVGEVTLLASTETCSRSEPRVVRVVRDQASSVVIELPEPMHGRGQIVDALTSEPLLEATVQIWLSTNRPIRPWKGQTSVGAQGRFELDGLVPGVNVLQIGAPGYAQRFVQAFGVPGQLVDFGSVGLSGTRSLEVRITSSEMTDLSAMKASVTGAVAILDRNFSSQGTCRFDGLSPGVYGLEVVYADGRTINDEVDVPPGRDSVITFPLERRALTVEVQTSGTEALPEGCFLLVACRSEGGGYLGQGYTIPPTGVVEVKRVDGRAVTLQVQLPDETVLAAEQFVLSGDDPERIVFRIRKAIHTFRIVDRDHMPIPAVEVALNSVGSDSWWAEQLETDSQGECSINGLAFHELLVGLRHPSYGVQPSSRITLDPAGQGPIEIVFAPDLTLRIRLVERNSPQAGVQVRAADITDLAPGQPDVFTDSQGYATWGPVAKGEFKIKVLQPGFWPADQLVRLEGDDPPIPVQVRRLGSVELTAKTPLGNPAPGVAIDLHSDEINEWVSSWVAAGQVPEPAQGLTTGSDGKLRVHGLPNGTFHWRATTAQGDVVEGDVVVPPQALAQVAVSTP